MLKKDTVKKQIGKAMRKNRVRARITGTAIRPRLSVFRSLKHIYAQLIDDVKQTTLVGVMSKTADTKHVPEEYKGKTRVAYAVGFALATAAKEASITKAVFDRNSYKYHGRVKAVADGARQGGLEF
ncbi:MAG: 50S ribosomal protein L18 [Candidatus Magasanikbacteria bacterium GW2011_GWA2_45_39]|uniref:Large ribosomal subunit protein uL18 n=2 Tax=Candidatus Magasanikiibacteriota TaxID=1752731 RepID=A0A0G1QFD4_9BACT|nr:MAG: 50S ribosomal protein L18 [Candidatus Magasanikbacteria bacterium GW2011_GWA2_45_39]HBW73668.1 50S ribosomal protein L18 [Candidatus Magasanikbacteria bacterium]